MTELSDQEIISLFRSYGLTVLPDPKEVPPVPPEEFRCRRVLNEFEQKLRDIATGSPKRP